MSATIVLPLSAQTAPTTPGARFGHAMSFHAGTGRTIVFGGERTVEGRTRLGDTWAWDGTAWTRVDSTGPSPRMDIAMAYDAARDRVVLFGGNGINAARLTDTWEWDGRSWAMRSDSGPGARIHPVMAYDARRQRIVLYGGAGGASSRGWLTDTWEWDGRRWERRATEGPQYVASAAYDATRQAVVALTLDAQDGSPVTGMSVWDGTKWTPLPRTTLPPLAPLEPVVEAAPPNALIAYRSNYHTGVAATWMWNGQRWTSDTTAGPGRVLGHAAAFDSRRGRMVVFGGLLPGEVPTDALWERSWERPGTAWVRRR